MSELTILAILLAFYSVALCFLRIYLGVGR